MGGHKTCSTAECGRAVQKEGLCYKCFRAKYGYPPFSAQDKSNSGTKIVGGGKVKKVKMFLPPEKAEKAIDRKTTLVKSSDEIDLVDTLNSLMAVQIKRKLQPLLADLRKSIDELQEMPVGEVVTKLAMMRDDIDEWEQKHAA